MRAENIRGARFVADTDVAGECCGVTNGSHWADRYTASIGIINADSYINSNLHAGADSRTNSNLHAGTDCHSDTKAIGNFSHGRRYSASYQNP